MRRVHAIDEVRLHAEVAEPSHESDLTVVFCHGWMKDLAYWDAQRDALRGHVRMVFFDQRGHGLSEATDRHNSSVDLLADDLGRVIDEVVPHGRIVLVGHSMGSMGIQMLATLRPSLFGDRVVGVVLTNTLARGLRGPNAVLNKYGKYFRPARPLIAAAIHGQHGVLKSVVRSAGPVGVLVGDLGDHGSTRTFIDFHRAFVDLDVEDSIEPLGRTDLLIVGSSEDRLTPVTHSIRLAEAIPTARLRIVPGAGHMLAEERPEVVTALIDEMVERLS